MEVEPVGLVERTLAVAMRVRFGPHASTSRPHPKLATTATTVNPISAGQCEIVSCDWKNPPQKATDLWFRGNDDAQGAPPIKECKPLNDLLYLPASVCRKIM